ncbi:MAG TPA: hypothetical protein VIX82_05625 [Solirubrobacteraceae bacterium]
MCRRLALPYRGQIMQTGTRERVFHTPTHPYTISLLGAVPVPVGAGHQVASHFASEAAELRAKLFV